MEKVTDTPLTAEVYENDIELYLKMFQEENEIEDLEKIPQNVWTAALYYIYKHVFKGHKDDLKLKTNYDNYNKFNNAIPTSNCNSYNYDLVNDIVDIYINICFRYDKEISILGFSMLTGIDRELIQNWGTYEKKLSSSAHYIYQKLNHFREESLKSKLISGNKNPVGVLGILNHFYGWNMPGVGREQTGKQVLTASELPTLGDKGNLQIAAENRNEETVESLEISAIEEYTEG